MLSIVAIAVAGTGCGDGGDGGGGDAAETPMARFVARADTLCARTSALVHDGVQPYMDQGREAVETGAIAKGMVNDIVAPDLEALVVALATLEWPAGSEAELNALLAELQAVADEARLDPLGLVLAHERALARAARLADVYGLTECGRLRIVLPSGDGEAEDADEDGSQFVERADALCRRAAAIVQAELQPYVNRGSRAVRRPATTQKMAFAIALELEAMHGAVRRLTWAEEDEERAPAFLDALEERFDAGVEEPRRLVLQNQRVLAPARNAAQDLGLAYCGRFWIVRPNARSDARLL